MNLPLSLHSRVGLLSIAMVAALFALNINGLSLIAEGMVADNIDIQLDSQIRMLTRVVDRQGQIELTGLSSAPELLTPWRGWGWDLRTSSGHWQRGGAPGQIEYPSPRIHVNDGIYSGKGYTASGEAVHVRRLDTMQPSGPVSIITMSPRTDIERELDRIRSGIYMLAAEILLALLAISILQILVGLYPLRKLVRDVIRVRSGEARSLPERQPSDLQPLASEINALILLNNAGLETARIHAANLAHAVKTPLASLMLQLEYEQASQEAQDLVAHLSQRVAHHLHRARSATAGSGGHRHADLAAVIRDVKATVLLVERSGTVDIVADIASPCIAAVEAEDLGEMISNLVENACRYARSRVIISAEATAARVLVRIEDDGPGIPEDRLAIALQPGVRLDEVSKGYGLGLAIVRELAELHGGSLALGLSGRLRGLCATLDLPR